MSDVRWASLGLMVAVAAALPMMGCSDSSTSCGPDMQSDASTPPIIRPGIDATTGGGNGEAGADAGGNGTLGSTCAAATDCRNGLTCVRPTDDVRPGEGFPNGMCTLDCTADATGASCRPFGGTCVQFNDLPAKAYCIEGCTEGPGAAAKCHGRTDAACQGLTDSTGQVVANACLPICTDDTECGTRTCNLGTGLCAAQPATGLPTGSSCMTNAQCLGQVCLDVAPTGQPTVGVCAGFCRFGGLEGCGYRRAGPVNMTGAACVVPTGDMPGDGDEGYCLELCDSDADCALQSPFWGCNTDPVLLRRWMHGACLPRTPGTGADAGREAAAVVDAAREAAVVDAPAPEAAAPVDAGTD